MLRLSSSLVAGRQQGIKRLITKDILNNCNNNNNINKSSKNKNSFNSLSSSFFSTKITNNNNNNITKNTRLASSLYTPELEKDSCGVGLVAHLKSKPSRQIIVDANEMLVRMSHRGGCGCEINTGDGAGILVAIPDQFMRNVYEKETNKLTHYFGTRKNDISQELPPLGQYAVGNIFTGKEKEAIQETKEIVNKVCKQRGLNVLGWRTVPTDNRDLGPTAITGEPSTHQIFIENTKSLSSAMFEKELLRIRKLSETEATGNPLLQEYYVNSLSCETITYKGQLTPAQLVPYFDDLQRDDFESHMALVHSRFSTNTFPSWDRAQPVRMMCHNGEINTLRGNKNWMYSRGGLMHSEYFKDETRTLLPVTSENMSDSGNFDSVLELLCKASDRSIVESVMMMVPEAWQDNLSLSDHKKAFYEYNSCITEPWDGPAMIAFTDGRYIGATLDRNGLRPSRYYVTHDDRVLLSSEVGVLPDLPEEMVKIKSRLEPGKMFLVDFAEERIIPDSEVKDVVAKRKPYQEWIDENMIRMTDWMDNVDVNVPEFDFRNSNRRFNVFGYTTETFDLLLYPMGVGGKEALGSMGNDTPLAVLSEQPRPIFDYFKQLFAQVTNPPIDPIREEMVMSLVCPVGAEANFLDVGPEHCARLVIDNPVLTMKEMQVIKNTSYRGLHAKTIDITFPAHSGVDGLMEAIDNICDQVSHALQGSIGKEKACQFIVLSDKMTSEHRFPIPSLLALGAVHQHLLQTQQRPKAAIFLESGDIREVHDYAVTLGFGADGICPYVAYEAFAKMNYDGIIEARTGVQDFDDEDLHLGYRKAVAKGILKVMSKMGISTLQSYKGAQVFEAVGLADDVIERCFTGTTSRIQGADLAALYEDVARLHEIAYPDHTNETPLIRNPGHFHYRDGGEQHLNTPASMVHLQLAARNNERQSFKDYCQNVDDTNKGVNLRGLLKFKTDSAKSIPLDEVEPIANIMKRFNTGAMSLGSISREAHETLAVAMNTIGGRSNTGEGGEDTVRFGDKRRSSIKQVASGRFGVTSHYLANSDQIQIKMAQGAKPGEGGELPGFKVTKYIASSRHTTPGVGLISPPPHHDIYSIEDLAQLIHDLKNSNPVGEVSVKLVSEVGVGVVAAGVAKAKADHITISGGDGGTGAAALTGLKNAGLPWELGIAEAQQTLVLNDLRSRVILQTDGGIKSPKDVIIAALLGAEEFGFATAPLIAMGCIMMRKCHLNTCPVGIATQDPLLRKKFSGKPEHVINFFYLMAEEIREIMAELGYRNFDEMIGQVQNLEVDESALNYKTQGLDLGPLLIPARDLHETAGLIHQMNQDHELVDALDNELIASAKEAIESGTPVQLEYPVTNLNRTVGTMLSYEISKRYGAEALPEDTIQINLKGHGGQSLGFALAKGITIRVEGDVNDYVGKGLSGGKISVSPKQTVIDDGFVPEDHVIAGNTCLYGATSGAVFLRGKAGERFCVRNSGALAVVEGVGDHACEYMTGGITVILGETGRNFAAGMSGGIAYVYDPNEVFEPRCNLGMVGLEKLSNSEESENLKNYIQQHIDETDSTYAKGILMNWDSNINNFVKVMPHDYKRILESGEDLDGEDESDLSQIELSAN